MAPNDAPPRHFFGPLLLAREFELTLSFYRGALRLPFEGSRPYAKCVSAHSTFSIVDRKWWAEVCGSDNPIQGESSVADTVLMIQVDDVDQAFRELVGSGTNVLSPPTPRRLLGIRTLFLRDPDGRCVALSSPMR